VDEGLSIELSGFGWLDGGSGSLWEQTAAYMARILAIIKHSDIKLRLFRTSEGERLLKAIQNVSINTYHSAIRNITQTLVLLLIISKCQPRMVNYLHFTFMLVANQPDNRGPKP